MYTDNVPISFVNMDVLSRKSTDHWADHLELVKWMQSHKDTAAWRHIWAHYPRRNAGGATDTYNIADNQTLIAAAAFRPTEADLQGAWQSLPDDPNFQTDVQIAHNLIMRQVLYAHYNLNFIHQAYDPEFDIHVAGSYRMTMYCAVGSPDCPEFGFQNLPVYNKDANRECWYTYKEGDIYYQQDHVLCDKTYELKSHCSKDVKHLEVKLTYCLARNVPDFDTWRRNKLTPNYAKNFINATKFGTRVNIPIRKSVSYTIDPDKVYLK